MKIIFLGTPDFAVATLKALVESKFNVVAVVTAPDKPAGRGMQLQESPVKKYALEQKIPVLQPEKLKSEEFLHQLKEYNADIQVVVAFRMLPEVVWNMPPLGTINVHASLLPDYRGAAPINWAIMNGEHVTGVTTFKLKHEIDTGDILLQKVVAIEDADDAGTLHDKLMHAGAELLIETIRGLSLGTLFAKEQTFTEQQKHAPKLFDKDCHLNIVQDAKNVHNRIRGLTPYPGAYVKWQGKRLKLFQTSVIDSNQEYPTGTLLCDGKSNLKLICGVGALQIHELQLEGKKRMKTSDFLNGVKVPEVSMVDKG